MADVSVAEGRSLLNATSDHCRQQQNHSRFSWLSESPVVPNSDLATVPSKDPNELLFIPRAASAGRDPRDFFIWVPEFPTMARLNESLLLQAVKTCRDVCLTPVVVVHARVCTLGRKKERGGARRQEI